MKNDASFRLVMFVAVLLLPAFLAAGRRPRTADSAVTPVYASWHQKQNDRIMADLQKCQGDVRTDLMPDNLHPNEAGYRVWLDAVKPKLDELMK